jgi:hypothetical protein
MSLWPPNWYLVAGIVAFVLASLAVQSWRELAAITVIVVMLIYPVKWIGVAAGLSVYGASTWMISNENGTTRFSFEASASFITAVILAALAMIAWREVRVRRQDNVGGATNKAVE